MASTATLRTNHGDIVLNLFADQAPKTVDNFAVSYTHLTLPTIYSV